MRLRQFMYRDSSLIREFLAQIEGGVFDEDTQTSRSEGKKGGQAGAKAGPVSGHFERGSSQSEESERIIRQTAASEFERLYASLESLAEGGFQFLDNIDHEIWAQLRRGEIVEVEAVIRPTGLSKVAELFETFESLMPIAEAAGVDSGDLDQDAMSIMQFIKQLTKMGPSESLSVIASLASAPQFQFACTLRLDQLLTDPDALEGEATVFGKIQRKLRPGETTLVGNIFAGLENVLDAPSKDELAKVFDDPAISSFGLANPQISHPAAVLTTIAIYR